MIIVHAGISEHRFFLWGERQISESGQTKRQKNAKIAAHPFACDPSVFARVLDDAIPKCDLSSAAASEVTIWLPTSHDVPVPSSMMLAPAEAEPATKTELRPWRISGLQISPQIIIKVLNHISERSVIAPSLILGSEFAFLTHALSFSAALVARQRYLPTVEIEDREYSALWEPTFQQDDYYRLKKLLEIVPPVFRAVGDENAPYSVLPIALARTIVSLLVDTLVRTAKFPAERISDINQARASSKDSIHDAWLAGLKSSNTAAVEFAEPEVHKFAEQVEAWRQPIAALDQAPLRLCFRLEEPARMRLQEEDHGSETLQEDHDDWQVRYFLQDKHDQSLLLPAAEAWENPASINSLAESGRRFNPREYLLVSLSQAMRLCPEIASSLEKPKPSGYQLNDEEALHFLKDRAESLEQAGFGVMLPTWWKRNKATTRARVSAKAKVFETKAGLTADQLVKFEWTVALGDATLTEKELLKLAELKSPLVNVKGHWMHINAAEIKAVLAFIKQQQKKSATVGDAIKLAIGAGISFDDVDVEVEAEGGLGSLIQQMKEPARLEELQEPAGFIGKLRPYQRRGYAWMHFLKRWGFGSCLADDMGLGKTVQTLAMIQKAVTEGESKPVLLVCPTSVLHNWMREAERFTPELKVLLHHGGKRLRGIDFIELASHQHVVLCSYALLLRDIPELEEIPWSGVILDEAQNIKNSETKQAHAARRLASGYKVALTGTPVENTVGDLWSIMEFLNPGLLGTQNGFRKHFLMPIQVGRDPHAIHRLKRITQPFILRRLKTDKSIIDDLPEKIEMNVFCSLTKEQVSLYSAVLKDMERKIQFAEGIERKGLILATLVKLKQICNHPAQFLADNSMLTGRSGKLDRLMEIIEEVQANREKVLIFTQFAEMGGLLQRYFEEMLGEEVLFLHGGVSPKHRSEMVQRFQLDGQGPNIFVLSLKAGGVGLNLTAANHVIHYDRWWNPAVENQASDRAFRIGQKKQVQVRKFVAAGTLEEKINNLIESKRTLAEDVVGVGEGWLTQLSNDELKNVFALSRETWIE